MFLYVLKRLAEMIPVLLVVVVATFFLAHAVPGGPFDKDSPMPAEVKKQSAAAGRHQRADDFLGCMA